MSLRRCSLFLVSLSFACGKSGSTTGDAAPSPSEAVSVGEVETLPANGGGSDGGAPTTMLTATAVVAPVFSMTEFPPKDPTKAPESRQNVVQLGHLRRGAQVAIKPKVIKKGNCAEGWYELESGGYICGKYATTTPSARDEESFPHAPYMDRPLPYDYALNLTNGTPLYFRMPKKDERDTAEKGLAVGRNRKQGDNADGSGDTPWYLKKNEGASRPLVALEDLKGESGLIRLRMVRGFYLAIDREAKSFAGKFWRTTDGMFAAQDHLLVHKSTTEFEGVRLDSPTETRKLPLGFIVGLHGKKYFLSDDGKKPKKGDHLDRFTIVGLTGKKVAVENVPYYETTDGYYIRGVDMTLTKPGPAPKDLQPNEKWIDVDIKTQTLVAFEGEKPVYATIVSTGRHDDTNPDKDHRTKPGTFRIFSKHVATTMDDNSASDGPYSIQDVPWTMYFNAGTALHGAFWHSSFGHERSHGCVNMTPYDAHNIFEFVGPTLPKGWQGVRATPENQGTRVIVHE